MATVASASDSNEEHAKKKNQSCELNSNDYPPLSAAFTESFAYRTVKDRLPIILTRVIDLLFRERNQIIATYGKDASEDTKLVIGMLSQLKNEMQTNKPFILLNTKYQDVSIWNASIEEYTSQHGNRPLWFQAPFLYVECYMYRRIFEAFQHSTLLRSFDPFQTQKEEAFTSSLDSVKSLGAYLHKALKNIGEHNVDIGIKSEFSKFLQVSLWGNRCDLSISAGVNVSQANPLLLLEKLKPNILVDETHALWDVIWRCSQQRRGNVRLDVILDNAGFELFCDMCLVEFLQEVELVNEVHWYVKVMPWYVSDTMSRDLTWLIDSLSKVDDNILSEFGHKWKKKIENSSWIIEEKSYWTLPHDYSEMKKVDPKLYNKLKMADVILFKGDLNYRKLVGDKQWPFSTPFKKALRGFEPASLCALRTIKCDTLAGLREEKAARVDTKDISWMFAGEFAVIQCLVVNS